MRVSVSQVRKYIPQHPPSPPSLRGNALECPLAIEIFNCIQTRLFASACLSRSVGRPRNSDGRQEISEDSGWMIIAMVVDAWLTILVGFVCLRLWVTRRREDEVARNEPPDFALCKNGSVSTINSPSTM